MDDLSDEARYPGLSEHGRQMLHFLREHPSAPRYTARCGHRLTPERLAKVREFSDSLRQPPAGWTSEHPPAWLADFAEFCYREAPFYRRHGARPQSFVDIPTFGRAELSREPWAFVPDTQPLEGMAIYQTSGTTGHPLTIISHPVTGASYLPLLRVALGAYGVSLTSGRGRVAYLLVGWQRRSYAYPSVVPEMDEAGCAKLNLHPADWRDPADRAKFLDACDPEFYTGDPIALAELARLPLRTRPRALVSTAMTLLPGLRRECEDRFGCPVIDLYSMNETGPIAYATPEGAGHRLLQPRLYAEILDAEGRPCPPGERGEIVLSGGMNPFLPLLRYRTDDYAALDYPGGTPTLSRLAGRMPTQFRAADGALINSLDVTNALAPFALAQFTLSQAADGGLRLRVLDAGVSEAALRDAFASLFGPGQRLTVEAVETLGEKVVQYTSEYPYV